LKSQISILEKQISGKNTKIDELKTEKSAIEKNVKAIEKMKDGTNLDK
jgi:prefoldin subunit 5